MRMGGNSRRWIGIGALVIVAAACQERAPRRGEPFGYDRPADGLLGNMVLQRVVDMQVARNTAELVTFLEDGDAAVRARAAFALASVRDTAAIPALVARLGDDDPRVRADAAFALGQFTRSRVASTLLPFVLREQDAGARGQMIEAIGKTGDLASLVALVNNPIIVGDTVSLSMALDQFAARGYSRPRGVQWLLGHLTSPDPDIRLNAAYYFGRFPGTRLWRRVTDSVRQSLDHYPLNEPAAMHLVRGVARLQSAIDLPALGHWAADALDWRVRVNALGGLSVQPDKFEALQVLIAATRDKSTLVAMSAASALLTLTAEARIDVRELRAAVEDNRERPHVVGLLLATLAASGDHDFALDWWDQLEPGSQEMLSAVPALGHIPGVDAFSRLRSLTQDADPTIAFTGTAALRNRWRRHPAEDAAPEAYYEVFAGALERNSPDFIAMAARALADSAFVQFGSVELLSAAYRRVPETAIGPALDIIAALTTANAPDAISTLANAAGTHPRLREAAADALAQANLDRESSDGDMPETPAIDWSYLATMGPRPLIRFETTKGTMVIVLDAEQAPQTVQSILRLAEAGSYDNTKFDRVIPNFVVESGDVSHRHGFGGPGYLIRSEITRIPFRAGVLGMSNDGLDTEGSRFFITHSMQPQFDGEYTAAGWLMEGEEVLASLLPGDRLIRATIVAPN